MNLVWDHERGIIVDAATGEVVDVIYSYLPPPPWRREDWRNTVRRSRHRPIISSVTRRYVRRRGRLRKALRKLREKGIEASR